MNNETIILNQYASNIINNNKQPICLCGMNVKEIRDKFKSLGVKVGKRIPNQKYTYYVKHGDYLDTQYNMLVKGLRNNTFEINKEEEGE